MRTLKALGVAVMSLSVAGAAAAADGPVAAACKDDIVMYCGSKKHESRGVRNCLEENKPKVSAACRAVLETTGMSGMGGMSGMQGMGGMDGMGGMTGMGGMGR